MSGSAVPIKFDCTNCGARLHVDGSVKTLTCTYCKTEMLLPESIWRRFHPEETRAAAMASAAPRVPPEGKLVRAIGVGVALFSLFIALVVGVIIFIATRAATSSVSISGPPIPSSPLDPMASPGDPCNGRVHACSRDNKAELACGPGQKMAVTQTCKGPNGCRATSDRETISCDTTYADPKDSCEVTDSACSTDHKAELRCQGGHYAVISTCKGPDGCTLTPSKKGSGYTLSCDDHVADVGDPCFDGERTACSSDKKAFLACTAQRFTVDHACHGGCKVKKLAGTGNVEMDCN